MEAWIQAHVHSIEFFGGALRLVVPDNAKTGVTRACRYDPDLNPTYGGARIANTATLTVALNNFGISTPADPSESFQQGGTTVPAFATSDIPSVIVNAILSNLVPPPPANANAAYCVVLPENVYNLDSKGNYWGQHGFQPVSYLVAPIVWMWVTHAGVTNDLTEIFSHELAETCSDPGAAGPPRRRRVARARRSVTFAKDFQVTSNGIAVQSYFSNTDQTCVVPTWAWISLMVPIGGPAGAGVGGFANADGRLELFTVGSNEALTHIWQTSPNNAWSSTQSVGAPANVQLDYKIPAVGRNSDGRLEAFVCHGSSVAHIYQTSPGGGWSAWQDLGAVNGIAGTAVVVSNADGRIEVFLLDGNGAIQHNWQQPELSRRSTWLPPRD